MIIHPAIISVNDRVRGNCIACNALFKLVGAGLSPVCCFVTGVQLVFFFCSGISVVLFCVLGISGWVSKYVFSVKS